MGRHLPARQWSRCQVFSQKPEEADRNQMLVYCHGLRLKWGSLIYANDRPIEYKAGFHGVTLKADALPLHGGLIEFGDRCEQFVNAFALMVSASAMECDWRQQDLAA